MFGALSDSCVSFLLEHGKLIEYTAGDHLFSLGDASDQFFIILTGQVAFYQTADGHKTYIRSSRAGEQIGFVGMIGLHARRGDAVIEQSGLLLEVSSALFHQVCEKFPEDFVIFMINISREMSREISHLDALCARSPAAESSL